MSNERRPNADHAPTATRAPEWLGALVSDIIDRIDELVDHQLQQESSGWDHNINQDKCWHCGRDWHGLPITKRIAEMYRARIYDEGYSLAEDDSPVVCPGSDFIGPVLMKNHGGPRITSVTISRMLGVNDALPWLTPSLTDVSNNPPPTRIQFWDRDFNTLDGMTATDWEWSRDGTRARFTLEGAPGFPGLTNVTVTTESPRRMWRVREATQYTPSRRIVVEVVDVHTELVDISALLPTWRHS